MSFKYGEKEIEYLKSKDKALGDAIEKIGHINRLVDENLSLSVIHHIVGQQISTAAQDTIWKRMCNALGEVTAETICSSEISVLQKFGMTFRKAVYIKDFTHKAFVW